MLSALKWRTETGNRSLPPPSMGMFGFYLLHIKMRKERGDYPAISSWYKFFILKTTVGCYFCVPLPLNHCAMGLKYSRWNRMFCKALSFFEFFSRKVKFINVAHSRFWHSITEKIPLLFRYFSQILVAVPLSAFCRQKLKFSATFEQNSGKFRYLATMKGCI